MKEKKPGSITFPALSDTATTLPHPRYHVVLWNLIYLSESEKESNDDEDSNLSRVSLKQWLTILSKLRNVLYSKDLK